MTQFNRDQPGFDLDADVPPLQDDKEENTCVYCKKQCDRRAKGELSDIPVTVHTVCEVKMQINHEYGKMGAV